MEFFDWIGIPQYFIETFLRADSLEKLVALQRMGLIISLAVAAGLYLIGNIFFGIGLSHMAKQAGLKHPWLGFFPIVNTWYSGKLAGEASFFGQKMKREGLYAALVETLYILLNAVIYVMRFLELDPAYYNRDGSGPVAAFMGDRAWVYYTDYFCSNFNLLLWFLLLMFFFVLYIAFFRKYYAKNPVLMTFLCALLPVRGFVVFAVRKNPPVNYQDFMRRRMEEYARRNAPYGNGPYGGGPYGNGPYGGGPYGGNTGGGQNPPQGDEPFGDFGGPQNQNGDSGPFSDF